VEEDVRGMMRSQIAALVVGLVLIFAVALVLDIGGEGAAPWYTRPTVAGPLVGGAAVIAGAFIGGASAAAASYLVDQRRFEREDAAVRRQVYSEFTLRWTLYEEAKTDFKQLKPGSPQKLDEAHRQLLRTFNALSLIAPEEVRAAADEVVKEAEGAPGRFWKVARKDVGLSD
jgi:hypothetical protein